MNNELVNYLYMCCKGGNAQVKMTLCTFSTGITEININSLFYLFATCVIFLAFLSSAEFLQNQLFSKNSRRNTIRVSNNLDPDQAQHFVNPDLGPICLQRLSADNTSRQILT